MSDSGVEISLIFSMVIGRFSSSGADQCSRFGVLGNSPEGRFRIMIVNETKLCKGSKKQSSSFWKIVEPKGSSTSRIGELNFALRAVT